MRTPTDKQFAILIALGSGGAGMSRTRRDTDPLLRWGWVTARWAGTYYQWVRLTADGYRAIAAYVDRHGLPEFDGIAARVRV